MAALLAAFNERFPTRTKTRDGWIGDDPHKEHPSGHNPDDTPGSLPEATDADTKPEVRGQDIDDRLSPAQTMRAVIQSILDTPADRDRLLYIIYGTNIWSARNGWELSPYDGTPHSGWAHFSGDPDHDADGAPWRSILDLGGSTMSDGRYYAYNGDAYGNAIVSLNPTARVIGTDLDPRAQEVPNRLASTLDEILTLLKAIKADLDQANPPDGLADHTHVPGAVERPPTA